MDKEEEQSWESECKKIHEYYLGRRTPIPQILAQKHRQQLDRIKQTYLRMYGGDLLARLQNADGAAFSRDLRSALAAWMADPLERDAMVAREAVGAGGEEEAREINYKALVEIFVGRKSSHMAIIGQIYRQKYRRSLDQDIASIEPQHPYRKILMALGASHRAHHEDRSQHIAKSDAKRLYKTGEGSSGPGAIDEAVVLEILSKRSIPQLKLTFSTYSSIYCHSYTKSLKNGNFGEFEEALRVVVKCIHNPPKYYAKALHGCLNNNSSGKGDVARIMVSRAEVDLDEIKRAFKNKNEIELRDAICGSIEAGDYRDFLVALTTRTPCLASSPPP